MTLASIRPTGTCRHWSRLADDAGHPADRKSDTSDVFYRVLPILFFVPYA